MKRLIISFIVVLGLLIVGNDTYAQDVRGKGMNETKEKKIEKKTVPSKKETTANIWIKGQVIDKTSGKGIANVPIEIVDFSKGLGLTRKVTNSKGEFILYPIKGAENKNLNLIIQNYQNLPPLILTITPKDKKVIIYKSGGSWSWTKE